MTKPSDAAEGTAAIAGIVVGEMPCDMAADAVAAGAADAVAAGAADAADVAGAADASRAAAKKPANIAAMSS